MSIYNIQQKEGRRTMFHKFYFFFAVLSFSGFCFSKFEIQKIIDLKKDEKIPQNILKKNSSRQIAFSVIQRIHKFELMETLGLKKNDQKKNYEFRVFFNPNVISKIIENGLLNQHQTKSSGGILNTELREYIQYGSGNYAFDTIVRSLVWYHDVEFYDDETFRQIDRAEYNNTSKGLIYRKIK